MRFCKLFRFLKPKPPTRSIHQLLIILRDNAEVENDRISSGLCREIHTSSYRDLITEQEALLLFDYLFSSPYSATKNLRYGEPFYWPRSEWPPRLEWLNQQIELTKP